MVNSQAVTFCDGSGKRPRAWSPSTTHEKDFTPKKATCHCQCDLLEGSSSNSSTEHMPKWVDCKLQPNLEDNISDSDPIQLSIRSDEG
ncbi:hypothetical protein E2C01_072919 [Portunus trituberculatus]|uniref:Uncharacterized protein n=1 Tax=Portunus trituberculatus TaxID=210409 RepID=A0A5B7I7Z7_PORTR|nr:hypothetical protein [Portunus trituberculatus]